MFIYLCISEKDGEEGKKISFFPLQNLPHSQKMTPKGVVVSAFFLDVCNLLWDMYRSVPPHLQFIILLHFEAERNYEKSRSSELYRTPTYLNVNEY